MVGPHCAKAVIRQLLVALRVERQLDRPIVWQIKSSPLAVIKLRTRRAARFAGLDQRAVAYEFEVERGVSRMPQCESPIAIQRQSLPHLACQPLAHACLVSVL